MFVYILVCITKLLFCIFAEEFSAHNANVTCLSLGQKSGLVLATGGSDFKVNLWKVDSEKCFMVIFLQYFSQGLNS